MPSDRRLKKDITSISNGVLEKIMKLNPVTYRYKPESESSKASVGFIAQEVDELFPELVGKNAKRGGTEELLSLNYTGFGVLAIKAIQEQEEELNSLRKENDLLKSKTVELESRLEALEQAIKLKKD